MSWQLFDRLRAYFRDIRVYRHERLYADQHSMSSIISGGEILNLSSQGSLIQQTNLQINRLTRYRDYDQMAQTGEIASALDITASEASLIDPEKKHTILIKAKRNRVRDELEDLYYNILMIDTNLRSWIRYLIKYGDLPLEIIPDKNRDGVMAVKHMNIYNFTRIETKFGDLVGFFYQDEQAGKPTFFHPWQVAHLRLTSLENLYHPYGVSIIDSARKHFKQLRLLEDSAIVHRITHAYTKQVFTIPVGQVPTHDIPQYIDGIARQYKKKPYFDTAAGDVNERYYPNIQEDYIFLPQRSDGTGPTVDTLPPAENLGEIEDIQYFQKKMIAGTKIPGSRIGIGEADEGSSEPLSKIAPEFAKQVQYIQQHAIDGLRKIGIVHLALRGYSAEDIKEHELSMTASSAIDELYRMEVWASRADTIEALKGTELFPDKWLLQHFTSMTEDEIDEMQEEKEERDLKSIQAGIQLGSAGGDQGGLDLAGGGMGGMGGGGGGGGIAGLPQLEGFDYELEQQVLNEIAHRHKKPKKHKVHKETTHRVYISGFDYLLNEGELDGLEYGDEELNNGTTRSLLIESVLSKSERDEAIEESINNILNQSTEEPIDDAEIRPSDLP